MALNKAQLIQDLKDIKNLPNNAGTSNTDAALEAMANAFEAFVKSGLVQGVTSDGKTVNGHVE